MTLRVDISIVPRGNEDEQYEIFRLDISNIGLIEDLGFGNQICRYLVKVYKINNDIIQRVARLPEQEFLFEEELDQHNRRDGAISLVQKATKLVMDRV